MASQDEPIKSEKISKKSIASALDEKSKEKLELNQLLNTKEIDERKEWEKDEDAIPYLYPSLNDPLFNVKIAQKKEFNDTRYDGKIYPIDEQAEKLCHAEFELSPHQQFVRNYLSFQTPYNSLLLYHGLGSGKTCSAIGIAEEMRDYIKQMGISQRIIIVASPNVQANFRLQLFDETKLKLEDDLWTMKSCIGNKLLKEINPLNMRGVPREKVISQIKHLINSAYLFLGYTEFANRIEKISNVSSDLIKDKEAAIKQRLKQNFDNRLIIIDEVHNIRSTDDNKRKRTATEFKKLVKNADNLRLLFLSATPLYNTYKEIISLINLMNLNDGRSEIDIKDVFDSDGNFKVVDGVEVGKQLLERKATGYISFVRGDNPYTFPFRIWPSEFAPEKTLKERIYPNVQLNGTTITEPIKFLSVYTTNLSPYQDSGYNYIVQKLSTDDKIAIETSDHLGYVQLQKPLEALNMIYPNAALFEEGFDANIDSKDLVGKGGLDNTMTYKNTTAPPSKTGFKYKPDIIESYGRIFAPENIGMYSSKIKSVCDNIMNSEGVILVYSEYLDGGVVPIALALEEMGITRYGSVKSLFEEPPVQNLDLKTYTNTNSRDSIPAKYIMITGDPKLSPNTEADFAAATQKKNNNGDIVKVILITKAGSEGMDFKFLRQVHIIEPWYNLSRIEQIIGRAVRNCSHKDLPFQQRNVEIFLYTSLLIDEEQEAADLYVYRLAEAKAVKIGEVTRVLKEVAVDCLLNSEQSNFSAEKLKLTVDQKLSNGKVIKYSIGDKPYTAQCDYMDTCMYKCKPVDTIGPTNTLTYSEAFIEMNTDKIAGRIKQLMKEKYFYEKRDLIKQINIVRKYPLIQIYAALNHLVSDKNEYIVDKYNRLGQLVNIGDYYFFQPSELTDEQISIYERSVPIPFKRTKIPFSIHRELSEPDVKALSTEKTAEDIEAEIADKDLPPLVEELEETLEESSKSDKSVAVPAEIIPKIDPGKSLLNSMNTDYNTSTSKQVIVRGEKDVWYKYSSIVLDKLEKSGEPKEILDELLISHIVETKLYKDLMNILNYLYSHESLTLFETKIKNYFDYHLLKNKGITGLLLHDWDTATKKPIQKLVILNDKTWNPAQKMDYVDLLPSIKEKVIPKDKLNPVFGFISNFKNQLMVFKIKENKPGHLGARCDQGGKTTAERLNYIVGTKKYSEDELKKIPAVQLCILQEYLLRIKNYNERTKNGNYWFLTPTEAIIVNTKDEKKN